MATAQSTGTALVYCRVSTTIQEERGTSLDSQEAACIAHAAGLGFTVGRVTREVYSGAELWDRPKLSQDRADIRAGMFAAVICYATDRLSRDPIHLAILAEECERAGVALHFVSETFDDSDESALIRYIKGYSNKKEREKIRERSLRGKHQRVLSGKIHGAGPEKYGWRRDKAAGVRVIYEPEAEVVRRIFTLLADNRLSYHRIARLLTDEGVPVPGADRSTDRKAPWRSSTIMRLVRDPGYKGEAVAWSWMRVTRPPGNHSFSVQKRPPDQCIPLPANVVPAIVSPEQWQRAQEAVVAQRGDHTRNEKLPYLLRGMLYCPVCGRKLWPAWNYIGGRAVDGAHRHRIYRCSSDSSPNQRCGASIVDAAKIESWAWAVVLDRLHHPEVLTAEQQRQQDEGPDPMLTDDLDKARREVALLEQKQRKLARRYAERDEGDGIPWRVIEGELKALEKQRQDWEATAVKLEMRLAQQQQQIADLERLYDYCQRMSARLDEATWEEKRTVLEALAVRITASGMDWHMDGLIPLERVPQEIVVVSQTWFG